MWGQLQNPGFIEFYEEFQHEGAPRGEDWMPMIRAVRYLQSQPYATRLVAFTSLMHFCVTTALLGEDSRGHRSVSITWSPQERTFRLSLDDPQSGRPHKRTCEERDFPSCVDSLIQGLMMMEERGER